MLKIPDQISTKVLIKVIIYIFIFIIILVVTIFIFNKFQDKTQLSDWLAILINLPLSILSATLLFNQNRIANNSSEQNTPRLTYCCQKATQEPKISLENNGTSDAQIVSIYYKTEGGNLVRLDKYPRFILNRGDKIDINFDTESDKFHSILIQYKNQLTGRNYVIGKNIHFTECIAGTPVGLKLNNKDSPIDYLEFTNFTEVVNKSPYKENIYFI